MTQMAFCGTFFQEKGRYFADLQTIVKSLLISRDS